MPHVSHDTALGINIKNLISVHDGGFVCADVGTCVENAEFTQLLKMQNSLSYL